MIDNMGFLDDSSSDEFNPIKIEVESTEGLTLLRQRSNNLAHL
jgi:hypothetical protein